MQMAFFSVPARGDAGLQEDLNVFLRSHRVLTVHREFVGQGENAFWALAVEYLDGPMLAGGAAAARGGKDRVDYKELLAPADFALFAKLRDWRKAVAEKEGVPVYAVLTNEQLAAVATKRPASAAALREVEGIGEAKAGKYGSEVLGLMAAAAGETAAGAGKVDKTVVP
jgi:superfamily II DNA helicase RecQ